jgi:hypothetical protein
LRVLACPYLRALKHRKKAYCGGGCGKRSPIYSCSNLCYEFLHESFPGPGVPLIEITNFWASVCSDEGSVCWQKVATTLTAKLQAKDASMGGRPFRTVRSYALLNCKRESNIKSDFKRCGKCRTAQ